MATIQPSLSQIKHLPAQSFLSGAEPLKELNNLTDNGGPASFSVDVEKAKPENAFEMWELLKVTLADKTFGVAMPCNEIDFINSVHGKKAFSVFDLKCLSEKMDEWNMNLPNIKVH